MPQGKVDRGVLSSNYQDPGQTYDDKKTEGAFEVLAQQIDANAAIFEDGGASLIKSTPITGVTGDNVQDQITELMAKILELQGGVVPSGTITNAMLAGGVTANKLAFSVPSQEQVDAAYVGSSLYLYKNYGGF